MNGTDGQQNGGAALIYCRVSTPGQEREGTSLDSQEAACRAYAEAHGYRVARVTREVGSGAELWDRALLSRDRDDLKHGGYAALIIYDLDRLARNPIHQALVIEECARAGIAVEIVLAPLDTSPEGMLITYVRGYAAQIEREKIRERQLRGKRQRALNGRIHGSGPELYGYRRDHTAGVRRIYEPEAIIVRRIYELVVSDHLSVRAVARLLNAEGVPPPSVGKLTYPDPTRQPRWGKAQVSRILRHPAYKGVSLAWRTQRAVKGQHVLRPESEWIALPDGVTPAIVSPELWQMAQDAISSHAAVTEMRNERRFYLLRGLVWCGVCGRRMEANIETALRRDGTRRRVRIYRCASRQTDMRPCGGSRVPAEWAETAVWRRVCELLRSDVWQRDLQDAQATEMPTARSDDPLTRDLKAAERQVLRIEGRQADLLRRYTASAEPARDDGGTDSDDAGFPWELVEREVARLEREKRQWRATVVELEQRISQRQASAAQIAERREYLTLLRPALDTLAPEEQRVVLETLLARVTANGRAGEVWLDLPTRAGENATSGVVATI